MHPFLESLSFVLRHPLNRKRPAAALRRFVSWHVGSRLLPGAVAVPFVDATRLLVKPGMTGATGNVYCGLHEFEDMAFVLHALRPGDLFVDIGANVGSYTILAAGGAGATTVAFEPLPSTFGHLVDNVRLNRLEALVTPRNVGLGSSPGSLAFTSDLDTVNHVVSASESTRGSVEVPVETLDGALSGASPALLKIDVEGFETEVLAGAEATMTSASLLAVVMELNGSGDRYGFDERKLHERMLAWGFLPTTYEPFERRLSPAVAASSTGNTLYVRSFSELTERLRTAPRHTVLGTDL